MDTHLGEKIYRQLPKQGVKELMEELDTCPQEYRGAQDKDRHWCLLLISAEVQGQETD